MGILVKQRDSAKLTIFAAQKLRGTREYPLRVWLRFSKNRNIVEDMSKHCFNEFEGEKNMKEFATITVLVLAAGLSGSASANFTMDEVFAATKLSVESVKTNEPDHAEHIMGFKGWISEDDAKTIVYIKHDGMTMNRNFTCHKHEAGIECHAQ